MPYASQLTCLLVDDDEDILELLGMWLQELDIEVISVTTAEEALSLFYQSPTRWDFVLSDVKLEGQSGLHLCEKLSEDHPELPVILLTAHTSIDSAVEALRASAFDYLQKPVTKDALSLAVRRASKRSLLLAELRDIKRKNLLVDTFDLVGESPAMQEVRGLVAKVAKTNVSVLITGESGTGKELIARAVHEASGCTGSFVAVNCAALPETLLESELFGHEKGAFTDAKERREGLFVQAEGGTVFLDEIGEMPMAMQSKLLRVLQENTVRPIGGTKEIPFHCRVISATNQDIESRIEDKEFREDLFYRINVVRIRLPALRSRARDTLLLAEHFLRRACDAQDKEMDGFSPEAARKILEYEWPGNVRELENAITRAVALGEGTKVIPSDLGQQIVDFQPSNMVVRTNDPDELPTLAEVESQYVRRVLKATNDNKTQAAEVLGISRRSLYRKLDALASSE